jgi:hypothetical protein
MSVQGALRKAQLFLLIACMLLGATRAESKDPNRTFSGRVLLSSGEKSKQKGVAGLLVSLRPAAGYSEQKDAPTAEAAGPSNGNQCPPPAICETTGGGGKFSFHQIKTGIYDLVIYKDSKVIYAKPEPLLIPEMPVSTSLVVFVPQPPQN